MDSPVIAAVAAVFVWWFATGAILLAVRRADRDGGHGALVWWGLPVLALGVAGLIWSLPRTGAGGAYAGFLSALAIWGWIELAFLAGIVTGPSRAPCPEGAAGWDRFARAWAALAYHEGLLFLGLCGVAVAAVGAANPIGAWTFALLFAARVSAKLNLFVGVSRINVEFLPRPLAHLSSYFRIARPGWLFAASITGLSFATACLVAQAWATGAPGAALLAVLSALALLEHWLMVLPLPDEKLWRWMLPAPTPTREAPAAPVAGDLT